MNKEYPFLSNAPIVEAVLEIRTTPAPVWEKEKVTDKIKSLFADGYIYEDEFKFQSSIQFIPSIVKNISESEWNGIRLTSINKTEIIKITRDAYVYSRLQPYPGWSVFNERALTNWNTYKKIAGQQNIKRIGIRFINRIEFIEEELPELLTIFPIHIGEIEKDIAGYLQQNLYAFENGKYLTNFIQTVQIPESTSERPAMILDIDVYTEKVLIIKDEDIKSSLEKIRMFKNDIFFGAIKNKLIGRLK
jgi:uncharacterized protein (TIGR04255 family)